MSASYIPAYPGTIPCHVCIVNHEHFIFARATVGVKESPVSIGLRKDESVVGSYAVSTVVRTRNVDA